MEEGEALHEQKVEALFKPKKGSVIPAMRRSVKRMMFDRMASFFCCSAAELSGNGGDAAAEMASQDKTPSLMKHKNIEKNGIVPYPRKFFN